MSSITCMVITLSIYFIFKKDIEKEYIKRYQADENIISNTFRQLELASENTNKNAVMMLSVIEKIGGIPTDVELDNLAKRLGISGFYVINNKGKFLRSSDISIELQHNSLFSYSPEYKNLINGTLDIAITPIIPSYPYDVPTKLTMIPNHNRKLILEASTHLEYIEKILQQLIAADKNIKSIGLYSPTGYELGSILFNGDFHQGRRDINKKIILGKRILNKELIISTPIILNSKKCLECKNKGVSANGEYYYVLTFKVSLIPLLKRISILKIETALIFLFIMLLSAIISKILSKKLVSRIKEINAAVNNIIESKNLNAKINTNGNDEISKLAIAFNKMTLELKSNQHELIKTEKAQSIAEIAKQVAHDIRSPLAALNILISQDFSFPEESRILFRNIINRIGDIANDLMEKSRDLKKKGICENNYSIQLAPVVSSIVREKQVQFCSTENIVIDFKITSEIYGLFAKVNLSEFKRMLSNIINNAVEALPGKGKVLITLSQNNANIRLSLADDGKGIPKEVLGDLGSQGFSYEKKGSGLGLYHARNTIEKLNGELQIISTVNKGTEVILTIPHAEPPVWFLPKLSFLPMFSREKPRHS